MGVAVEPHEAPLINLYKILNYLLIITVPSQAYIILATPQGSLNVNFYEHFNRILKCRLNQCPDSLLSSISSADRIANKSKEMLVPV